VVKQENKEQSNPDALRNYNNWPVGALCSVHPAGRGVTAGLWVDFNILIVQLIGYLLTKTYAICFGRKYEISWVVLFENDVYVIRILWNGILTIPWPRMPGTCASGIYAFRCLPWAPASPPSFLWKRYLQFGLPWQPVELRPNLLESACLNSPGSFKIFTMSRRYDSRVSFIKLLYLR
jgi:hypothetical protein